MNLANMSKLEFLTDFRETVPASDDSFSWSVGSLVVVAGSQRAIEPNSEYSFVDIRVTGDDQVYSENVGVEYLGELIGFYHGEVLSIANDLAHRGQDLGARMVIEVAPHRDVPEKRTVSEAGRIALERAIDSVHGLYSLKPLRR